MRRLAVPMEQHKKWHYTKGRHLANILEDCVIRPATLFVPANERPIVWFSTNQQWEPTVGPKERLELYAGGLVRFGVDPDTAPHNWQTLKELSGMSSKEAQRLYRAAIEEGARPGEWWGTFDPVLRSQWVSIQVHENGRWVEVMKEAVEERVMTA